MGSSKFEIFYFVLPPYFCSFQIAHAKYGYSNQIVNWSGLLVESQNFIKNILYTTLMFVCIKIKKKYYFSFHLQENLCNNKYKKLKT